MNTASHVAVSNRRNLRLRWSGITTLLAIIIFMEAVFAGAMLSGIDWARGAHSVNALIVTAVTMGAGFGGVLTLRNTRHGLRLGLSLLSLAALMLLQIAIGVLQSRGTNLLWLHIPLGVAVVSFAVHAVTVARRLGED